MTLKDAIGKCGVWLENQPENMDSGGMDPVTFAIHKVIAPIFTSGQSYKDGKFFVVRCKHGYWVRGAQYRDSVDADICTVPVLKIEKAIGKIFVADTFLGPPFTIFKLTTSDAVYYWDGANILSPNLEDLQAAPIEPFCVMS